MNPLLHGEFLESPDSPHFLTRESFLEHNFLEAVDTRRAPTSIEGLGGLQAIDRRIQDDLALHGFSVSILREPLEDDDFIAFGESFGSCQEELDKSIQSQVSNRFVLNLNSLSATTNDPRFQPFSCDYLTLHTESSGRSADSQPRYIILMCLEPGDEEASGRTVIVPIEKIISRLPEKTISILYQTRYANNDECPNILRHSEGRWTISFRDFKDQMLRWTHVGGFTVEEVNGAIGELLSAYYDASYASSIYWERGMIVILDNHRLVHGRSKSKFGESLKTRKIKRVRVAAPALYRSFARSEDDPRLFENIVGNRRAYAPASLVSPGIPAQGSAGDATFAFLDERAADIFERAEDPTDAVELRNLWLGRVEAELKGHGTRGDLAALWKRSRKHRSISSDEILNSPGTVSFVKEMFNTYFRDDLYGQFRSDRHVILSSGAADESRYGLPGVVKHTIKYALDRDWYGYSDSCGREATRRAVADYENERLATAHYSFQNVALTMGATLAVSSLADLLLSPCNGTEPVLCAIPNYPPLVSSLARRHSVRLVPLAEVDGGYSLAGLAVAVARSTPMIFLQTVINPTGLAVSEAELAEFIRGVSPSTIIVLDESHECLGTRREICVERTRQNVVRISGISKSWSAPGLKVGWILANSELISDYYEYASTSFGGPASINFTMLEIVARFEAWRISESSSVTDHRHSSFEKKYGIEIDHLQKAYHEYCEERRERESSIRHLREFAVQGLKGAGVKPIAPDYSINLTVDFDQYDDSYLCFRELLRRTGVSLYPTLLNFCFAGSRQRLTFAVAPRNLESGIDRIGAFVALK